MAASLQTKHPELLKPKKKENRKPWSINCILIKNSFSPLPSAMTYKIKSSILNNILNHLDLLLGVIRYEILFLFVFFFALKCAITIIIHHYLHSGRFEFTRNINQVMDKPNTKTKKKKDDIHELKK